jgi:hypothetical protein
LQITYNGSNIIPTYLYKAKLRRDEKVTNAIIFLKELLLLTDENTLDKNLRRRKCKNV